MAAAYAISSTLVEPVLTVITARALGVSPWVPVRSLVGVVQATVLMAAAVLATRLALVAGGVPAGARMALTTLVGMVVFGAACLWREPELKREVRTIMRRFSTRTPATPGRCTARSVTGQPHVFGPVVSGIPSVSVVVATHNRAERLRALLEGLRARRSRASASR